MQGGGYPWRISGMEAMRRVKRPFPSYEKVGICQRGEGTGMRGKTCLEEVASDEHQVEPARRGEWVSPRSAPLLRKTSY
jgi:hypothetical protein